MSAGFVCDGCGHACTDTTRVESEWWHLAQPARRRQRPDIYETIMGRRGIQAQHSFCTLPCLIRWAVTQDDVLADHFDALADEQLEDEVYDGLRASWLP